MTSKKATRSGPLPGLFLLHAELGRVPAEDQAVLADGRDPSAIRDAVMRLLKHEAGYRAVAVGAPSLTPQHMRDLTQNGEASYAWARLPPPGIFPCHPVILTPTEVRELRSTTVGDIVVDQVGAWHILTGVGFQTMSHPPIARYPENDCATHDGRGRRVHSDMTEQHAIARAVAEKIVATGQRSVDLAEAEMAKAGVAISGYGFIAQAARDIASQELGHSFSLSTAALERCAAVIADRIGVIPPSPEALRTIIETGHSDFVEVMADLYPEPGSDLDTAEREELMDITALHFTQRPWPCNGESVQDSRDFLDRLRAALEAAGWNYAPALTP